MPGETEVEFVVRTMRAAMSARRPEHELQMHRLIEKTPALQARLFQAMWASQEPLVESLLRRGPRTDEAEFRARILAYAVAGGIRVAYVSWIKSGQNGSAWHQCEKAIAALREAFGSVPRKVRAAKH